MCGAKSVGKSWFMRLARVNDGVDDATVKYMYQHLELILEASLCGSKKEQLAITRSALAVQVSSASTSSHHQESFRLPNKQPLTMKSTVLVLLTSSCILDAV
jgi:hypothetical protein